MADADRERLIEILKLDPCPSPYLCDENCKYANLKQCYEERTADLLLEHGVIAPPCKVGDTVYRITQCSCEDIDGEQNKLRVVGCNVTEMNIFMFAKEWGSATFPTREEAEKALKERENNA
jgi:hypothetical protein